MTEELCTHCGSPGCVLPNVCYDCAVMCSEPGCENPADPAAIGGLCLRHIPADNTLPVDES